MRRLLLVIGCLWAAGAGAQGYLGDPRNPEVQRREQEILKEQDDRRSASAPKSPAPTTP
jgi:hypothetical protein